MLVIPGVLKRFSAVFLRQGFQCYLVGGAIRDMLIGRRLTDFDVATDALPEQVQDLFRRVIPTGIKHGTVTVLFQGTRFEVTTFRIDREYLDGRRPDSVVFTPSIEEDLKRRDFTINAMAYDLAGRRLLDPHGGREDLRQGVLRAIGVPLERFLEDGLRPLRACRFAAQFGFTIEPETFAAIPSSLDTVRKVSAERIREELVRLLAAPEPSIGFRLMRRSGLLALLLPELDAASGVEQRGRQPGTPALHCFDVLEHSMRSCDAAPPANFVVRLAALLHDIGKPQTLERSESGDLKFHGHELASAELTEGLLRRLRFSNEAIRRTCHLVRNHMYNYTDQWSDAAVRRLVARVGEENLPDLLALRRADQIGTCGDTTPSASLIAFEKRLEQVLAGAHAFSLKDLAVDGDALMAALGLPPGPKIGILLAQLLDSVLADPSMNERERLLEIARRFYEQRLAQD
jgi:poly(A) polymerase/tRNA nucleotidyltransferase (CCA-adding enzyme)